jgi:hypothetical protein
LSHYESPRTVGRAFEEIADDKIEIDPNSILLEKEAEKVEEEKKEENE